jgi:hypothetical protein
MTMSMICSWRLPKTIDRLALALVVCCSLGSAVRAETESVRLGVHFRYSADQPYSKLHSISEVLDQLKFHMPQFVTGFDGCSDIVSRDLNDGTPRDKLRSTWTIIQSFRTQCWAVLQFDPTTPVAPTGPEDQLTPAMVHGIMAGAERLSRENEELARVLFTFGGGTIICKDKERCELSSPEGGEWANYSLYLDLILVHGNDWFFEVAQAYRGRISFVYGVRWRDSQRGGEVISIFPDLRK